MNTKEIIRERSDVSAVQPMAARAVAICEGCPLAKFCAIKQVAPCETSEIRTKHVEDTGGDYSEESLDKPIEVSYRKKLMDDTIPFVMANLQKKKDQRPRQQSVVLKPVTQKPVVKPRPVHVPLPTPKLPEVARVGSADIIADILMSMIGVSSISTGRDKNKV